MRRRWSPGPGSEICAKRPVRAKVIALNCDNSAALNKRFLDLKPALAEAVRDHSALKSELMVNHPGTSQSKPAKGDAHDALCTLRRAKGQARPRRRCRRLSYEGPDLVIAETGTVAWFAVRFDKTTLAIFDAFDDEAGRMPISTAIGPFWQAIPAPWETFRRQRRFTAGMSSIPSTQSFPTWGAGMIG